MSDEFAEIERKLKKLLVVPGWSLMRGDEFLPRWQALCGEAGVEVVPDDWSREHEAEEERGGEGPRAD